MRPDAVSRAAALRVFTLAFCSAPLLPKRSVALPSPPSSSDECVLPLLGCGVSIGF
jgi:hypothetical protein